MNLIRKASKTAITVKRAGHELGENVKAIRSEAEKTVTTMKKAGNDVGESVKAIRAEAKKSAATVKNVGVEILKDAPEAAQEARNLAEGAAMGASRRGKAIYADVSKKLKDSKNKGW